MMVPLRIIWQLAENRGDEIVPKMTRCKQAAEKHWQRPFYSTCLPAASTTTPSLCCGVLAMCFHENLSSAKAHLTGKSGGNWAWGKECLKGTSVISVEFSFSLRRIYLQLS